MTLIPENTREPKSLFRQVAFALPDRLLKESLPVSACYQGRNCSRGCLLTFARDLLPDQAIRLAGPGQEEPVLGGPTIWGCSSWQTCTCCNGGFPLVRPGL